MTDVDLEQIRFSTFEADVESVFGLVPNFFKTGAASPGLIEKLWSFARSAYLDNPLPSLFKERLFVHLSRFCPVRYCIVRHVGFLIGHGRPAGDATAPLHTIEQVISLLRRPTLLEGEALDSVLQRLGATRLLTVPAAETSEEQDIFAAASLIFLEPARAESARRAIAFALGQQNLELLVAFLAFIRTAHYWTLNNPNLAIEADMDGLLRGHEVLAKMLLDDPEASRCEMGLRLSEELKILRGERDDRELLKTTLAVERDRQKLLLDELNHRIKNTLTIVQAVTTQTLRNSDVPLGIRNALDQRLRALARGHDLLITSKWEGARLRDVITQVISSYDQKRAERIHLSGPDVALSPQQALAFSLVVNELATNAIKHGSLSNQTGAVEVNWTSRDDGGGAWLVFTWRETGGPAVTPPQRIGFGTKLIERGLGDDLGGSAKLDYGVTGIVCSIEARLQILAGPAMASLLNSAPENDDQTAS
jgi:two-component sensor histidine kinase